MHIDTVEWVFWFFLASLKMTCLGDRRNFWDCRFIPFEVELQKGVTFYWSLMNRGKNYIPGEMFLLHRLTKGPRITDFISRQLQSRRTPV